MTAGTLKLLISVDLQNLRSGRQFTLGGTVGIAVGPVGRQVAGAGHVQRHRLTFTHESNIQLPTDMPHQSSAQLSKSWLSSSLSDTHQKLNLILATETMDVGIFTMY